MILIAATVLLGVAVILGVGCAVGNRSLHGDLERFIQWKADEYNRMDERWRALDTLRLSLEESHALRERLWLDERRELLDRIQNPLGAQMRAIDQLATDEGEAETDADVDLAFAADHPADATVTWDVDLQPLDFDLDQQDEAVAPFPDDAIPTEVGAI